MGQKTGGIGSKYAWVIAVVSLFLGLGTVVGTQTWGFVAPFIAEEFGVSVASITIATSLYGLFQMGLGFIMGPIGQRLGIRITCTAGAVGLGLFIFLAGTIATSTTAVIILYGLAGCFASICGGCMVPLIFSNWFAPNMRGKGMVINTLGGSGGGMLLGIVAPQLLLNGGWHSTMRYLGLFIIVGGIIWFLVARDNPAKIGTVPLGADPHAAVEKAIEKTDEEKAAEKAAQRTALFSVLKMPITWLFGIMNALWYCYFTAKAAFQATALLEVGYDIALAGAVSSITIFILMFSQIVCSTLSDHFSRKKIFSILNIGSAVALIAIFFMLQTAPDNLVVFFAPFVVLGLFSGNAPLLQNLMGEIFPPNLRGAGPGVVSTITLLGTFGGPLLAAAFVNLTGSAVTVYIYCGVCLFIAGLISLIFFPNTGGKYGDPMAKKYEEEKAAKQAAEAPEA